MDERAREVFAEAYETLKRTADIKVSPSANEAWLARKPDPVTQPAQFNRWLDSQPEQQEVVPPQRSLTSAAPEFTPPAPTLIDSQTLRWQNYIDGQIGEHRAVCADWIKASAEAIVHERKQHRADLDKLQAKIDGLTLRVDALAYEASKRQTIAEAVGEIIELPNPLRSRRAG